MILVIAILSASFVDVATTPQLPTDWQRKLMSDDADTRRLTAEALGSAMHKPAIALLTKLFGDDDKHVVEASQIALKRIGHASIPAIAELLIDQNPQDDSAALETLYWFKPTDLIAVSDAVAKALQSDNPVTRIQAASILEQIGPPAKKHLPELFKLLKDRSLRPMQIADRLFPPENPNEITTDSVAIAALTACQSIDPGSTPHIAKVMMPMLLDMAKSDEYAYRTVAMEALLELQPHSRAAIPKLLTIRDSLHDFHYRQVQVVIEMLLGVPKWENSADCWAVAADITEVDERRIAALKQLINDQNNDPVSIETWQTLLTDYNSDIVAHAIELIDARKLTDPRLLDSIIAIEDIGTVYEGLASGSNMIDITGVLARFDADTLAKSLGPILLDIDADLDHRIVAAQVLSRIVWRTPNAVNYLKEGTEDDSSWICIICEQGCIKAGILNPGSAVETNHSLNYEDGIYAQDAIWEIEDLGLLGRPYVSDLYNLIDNPDESTSDSATRLLIKMDPSPKLCREFYERVDWNEASDPWLYRLSQLKVHTKIILPKLMQQSWRTPSQTFIMDVLITMGPDAAPALPKLTDLLEQELLKRTYNVIVQGGYDDTIVIKLLQVIAAIGPKAAPMIPQLVQWLDDGAGGARIAAIDALGAIGPKAQQTIAQLEKLALHHDMEIRLAACAALIRISDTSEPYFAKIFEYNRIQRAKYREADPEAPTRLTCDALLKTGGNVMPHQKVVLDMIHSEPSYMLPVELAVPCLLELAQIDERAILSILIKTAKQPTEKLRIDQIEIASQVLIALGDKAKPAIPALKQLRRSTNPEFARLANDTLLSLKADTP